MDKHRRWITTDLVFGCVALMTLTARAANPSFDSFNSNDFTHQGNSNIRIDTNRFAPRQADAAGYVFQSNSSSNGVWQVPAWSGTSLNMRQFENSANVLTRATNTFRLMAFGDSRSTTIQGGKVAGLLPALAAVTGNRSGGITENYPYLTHTGGTSNGNYAVYWKPLILLTNGGAGGRFTNICAIANGPSGNASAVWCDTISYTYLRSNGLGNFKILISTNGGGYGEIASVTCNGTFGSVVTNFARPLGYYNTIVSNTSGTVYILESGLWNQNQLGVSFIDNAVSGLEWTNFTDLDTNITWPIITNWNPTLVISEALDPTNDIARGVGGFESMLSNNAVTNIDIAWIGTPSQATNGNPTVNDGTVIPMNNLLRAQAVIYHRAYWDSYNIVSYEDATALGWTVGDGTHFNLTGATIMGNMLWFDIVRSMNAAQPVFSLNAQLLGTTTATNINTANITNSATGIVTIGGTTVATNLTTISISPVVGPTGSILLAGFFKPTGINFLNVNPASPSTDGSAGLVSLYDGNNNHKMGLEGGGSWWSSDGHIAFYYKSGSAIAIKYYIDAAGGLFQVNGAAGLKTMMDTNYYFYSSVGGNVSSGSTITPTAPVFHVTGTTTVNTINLPASGFTGTITIIPDGVFTTGTSGNIALASTTVVSKALIFTYDGTKWYPSY